MIGRAKTRIVDALIASLKGRLDREEARETPHFWHNVQIYTSAQAVATTTTAYTIIQECYVDPSKGEGNSYSVTAGANFTCTGTAMYMCQLSRGNRIICGEVVFRALNAGVTEHNNVTLFGVDESPSEDTPLIYRLGVKRVSGTGDPNYTMKGIRVTRGYT